MKDSFTQIEEKEPVKNEPSETLTLAEEKELVTKAKIDQEAFSRLYECYFTRIYAYVYKRVGHKETVEDLVSEIFTKAFVNIDKFQYRGYSFGAWLYQLSTNHLIDFYRKKAKMKEVELEDRHDQGFEGNEVGEQIDQKQTNELVQEALKDLPIKYQEVILLKFFSQLSNQEIARVTKQTPNNVGVIVYRSLKKFKKEFIKNV